VDSTNLTTDQAAILRQQAGDSLADLQRLRRRMARLHFPHRDPLYAATVNACNAMQHLTMTAHYLSCESGVGRAAKGK
jgi:hypothetical protein